MSATVKDFFNSLNFSILPENAATYIRNEIATDENIGLLDESDEDFVAVRDLIMSEYPNAISSHEEIQLTKEEAKAEVAEVSKELAVQNIEKKIKGYQVKAKMKSGAEAELIHKKIKGYEVKLKMLKSKMEDGGTILTFSQSAADPNRYKRGGGFKKFEKEIGKDISAINKKAIQVGEKLANKAAEKLKKIRKGK